ncbi:MAG: nucleoside deaminase [Candidatus Phytoplasma pruni]|uniref:nucleoside deaminase n=1 Tax=Milkweed yellows phytoplasma TaxID=208434 RepID=UPI0004744859
MNIEEKHFVFMKEAFKEAKKAFLKDEVPVGAVAIMNDKIISRAHNNIEKSQLFYGHAEFLLLMKLNKKLKTYRMDEVIIYITLAPCLMCAGALIQSRIQTIYYSAFNPKSYFFKKFFVLLEEKKHKQNNFIKLELLEKENEHILKKFFYNLRKK